MQPDQPRLRMTSIERFHLLDDQPAWPNWIGSILNLEGEIDPVLARQAIDIVLPRHSLIASRVSPRRRDWIVDPKAEPVIRFIQCDDIEVELLPSRPDIRNSAGSMFVAHTDGRRTRICLLIHHGLCDGIGGLQFVREWLQVYDDLFHGRPDSRGLGKLDSATLANRNRLYLTSRQYLVHLWKQPLALFGASLSLATDRQTKGMTNINSPIPVGQSCVPQTSTLPRPEKCGVRPGGRECR